MRDGRLFEDVGATDGLPCNKGNAMFPFAMPKVALGGAYNAQHFRMFGHACIIK